MKKGLNWTKRAAIKELGKLVEEIDILVRGERLSDEHTRWMMKTTTFLREVFGEDSDYYQNFTALLWRHGGQAVIGGPARPQESMNPQLGIDRINNEAYQRHLKIAKGILAAAKDELSRKDLGAVYKGKNTGPEASILMKILNLIEHKLRKVMRSRPEKEEKVQDAFEDLLVGADISYSREKETIEYSTKNYIPDFTMSKADLAVDVKLCSRKDREKDIIAEVNDDILAYQTKFGNVIFIVYDLGIIRDVDRFTSNFQKYEGVVIKVVKH